MVTNLTQLGYVNNYDKKSLSRKIIGSSCRNKKDHTISSANKKDTGQQLMCVFDISTSKNFDTIKPRVGKRDPTNKFG